jgi:hypothetical protein
LEYYLIYPIKHQVAFQCKHPDMIYHVRSSYIFKKY